MLMLWEVKCFSGKSILWKCRVNKTSKWTIETIRISLAIVFVVLRYRDAFNDF